MDLNNFRAQALFHGRGDKASHLSPEQRDFPNQARTHITVSLGRHHKNSFHIWFKLTVHHGHLQFVFVVGYRANASQNHIGAAKLSRSPPGVR